jgi:hypothetical protein
MAGCVMVKEMFGDMFFSNVFPQHKADKSSRSSVQLYVVAPLVVVWLSERQVCRQCPRVSHYRVLLCHWETHHAYVIRVLTSALSGEGMGTTPLPRHVRGEGAQS